MEVMKHGEITQKGFKTFCDYALMGLALLCTATPIASMNYSALVILYFCVSLVLFVARRRSKLRFPRTAFLYWILFVISGYVA